jgi:oligoendopeptidase F
MKWSLSYPAYNTTEFSDKCATIQAKANRFAQINTAQITVETFAKIVKEYHDLLHELHELQVYTQLRSSLDVTDDIQKQAQSYVGDFTHTVRSQIRFFHQWWVRLPQDQATAFAQTLGEDSYAYLKSHAKAQHVLPQDQEHIISLKDTCGSEAFIRLYDSICAEFEFTFEQQTYSYSQMRQFLYHADRKKREQASKLILQKFEQYSSILSAIYQAVTRDYDAEHIQLRNYQYPLQPRLVSEDFTQKGYDALQTSVKKHTHLFQRFFQLKAQLLGLSQLELYDMYAPISLVDTSSEQVSHSSQNLRANCASGPALSIQEYMKTQKEIPLSDAFILIEEALKKYLPFAVEYIQTLKDQNRIDVSFHPKKQGGAYCDSLSNNQGSFVFMQYLGTIKDVFTLAHELGHAVHFMITTNKSVVSYHSSIGIAESVSTLFEECVFEYLLTIVDTPFEQALLCESLSDAYSTITRQAYIASFEQQAHELVSQHKSVQDITAVWTAMQKEQFSTSVRIADKSISWMYIPHIYHTPFYCYNYALGNCISCSIVNKLQLRTCTPQQVLDYLRIGGTKGTVESARAVGLDIESTSTYDAAFALVEKRLRRLEQLMNTQAK